MKLNSAHFKWLFIRMRCHFKSSNSDWTTSASNCAIERQGRREAIFLGSLFQNFFRTTTFPPPPPRRQLFRENFFPDEYVVIAFQRLHLNFSYQISVLCPKKPKYLALFAEIFHPENDWGPTKNFWGPSEPEGARGNLPPLPPPLSAALSNSLEIKSSP